MTPKLQRALDARRYRKRHPERVRERERKARAGSKKKFVKYKARAKRHNQDFSLSYEQFCNIRQMPCWYCGVLPEPMGIDRRDSAKEYVQGNVVPCCSDCNYAKRTLSETKFFELIKRIHAYAMRGAWWV